MKTKHLRPAEGRVVYREDGSGPIPDTGEDVPLTTYYRMAMRDGDLEPAPPRKRERAARAPDKGGQ